MILEPGDCVPAVVIGAGLYVCALVLSRFA